MAFTNSRWLSSSIVALGFVIAGNAQAQEAGTTENQVSGNQATGAAVPASDPDLSPTAPPAAAGGGEAPAGVQEIVVTGSRIVRRDYAANSPIVTVQSQALENLSPVTLDNALQKLPQFTGINGQATTGSGFGQTGAATLNLRNLGDNRNLVLLDGRRLQPSTTSFAVDINNIPSALIENVEVITGGASAVYGSDAVAGVINFKLRHNFEGVELNLKKGISERGQYASSDVSLIAGTNFADNRGNIVLAANYAKRGATFQNDLPFYRRALAAGSGSFAVSFLDVGYYQPELEPIVPLPGGAGFAPNFPVSGPVQFGFNTDGTSIFNLNTAAGYNGGVYPQNPYYAINNGVKFNANYNQFATTPLERYSGFGRLEFKLADEVTFYAQGIYTHYDVKNVFIPLPAANFWAVSIPRDAAHPIPASFASLLNTRPVAGAPWRLGRALAFIGQPTTNNENDTYQALVGLSGSFADRTWTWDIYGSHGDTQVDSTGEQGYALLPTYRALLQAPNYGAGFSGMGGSCTSGISPFVAVSQDCIDLLTYRYRNRIRQKQDVVEANLQGKVADLPAGELRVAIGADYRRNKLRTDLDPAFRGDPTVDPSGVASSVVGNFAANSSAGSNSVKEVFGEILIPILKDLPLIQSFDVDLAYRYSDYRLSGGVSTYKADANWALADFLRLRGGYQRAVRAPNVTELFSAQQSRIVIPALDPCVNAGPFALPPGNYGNNAANPDVARVRALCTALSPNANPGLYNAGFVGSGTPVLVGQLAGNPNASPESADTYTVGAIFSPKGLPLGARLSMSVDYYRISVRDAIAALDPNQTYQLCFNAFGTNPSYDANNPYCRVLVRAPGNGLPAGVNSVYENQGGIKTQGIDAQFDLTVPAGIGAFNLNAVANYLIDYKVSFAPGVPFVDYSDTISSTAAYFRWRSLVTASYRGGGFNVGLRWKHLPSANDSTCTATCLAPDTTKYDLFDLFLGTDVGTGLRLTAGVDNLFDKGPRVVGGIAGNTNVGEYDVVGRQFYVAARAKF
jgi:outer membrane receptor protein involved in Fe transport